ncbi:hypothetical protein BJX70DRAFT_101349 [Aspergillus crustosus]
MKFYLWLLPLFPLTTARTASFHPTNRPDITYSITVPISNNKSSPAPSSILFRIQAPSSIEWIALAQGTHMADANMFLVYASSSNTHNITVSPRTAPGHIPPRYNPHARVEVLPGSGIQDSDGRGIVADIECFTCLEGYGGVMDPESEETHWVWAFREAHGQDGEDGLRSDDVDARIHFHDSFGRVLVDLSHAKTHRSPSSSPPGDDDLFRDPDFRAVRPIGIPDEDRTGDDNGERIALTHGFLMVLSFLILFPLFALSVPLGYPVMKIHAPLQAITVAIAVLGAILGFNLWSSAGRPNQTHPILGLTVITSLLLFQPVLGYLQHRHFIREGGKSYFAYVHRWLGRIGIVFGAVNGILGLLWVGAGDGGAGWLHSALVLYAVVAGGVALGYIGLRGRVWLAERRRRKGVQEDIRGRVVGGYRDEDQGQDEDGDRDRDRDEVENRDTR